MRILTIATLSVVFVYASDKITIYQSDHFELITDGSKGRAQEILGQFERVRSFFHQIMPLQAPLMKPRIVLFGSEKDFREVASNEVASAYYTPMPHRDMIAIGAMGRDYDAGKAVHEYLHMLVRYTGSDLPLWMNEGIAELYSNMQPVGKKIQVGAPIVHHVFLLRDNWLGLENVLGVDHSSPIYNRRAHAGGFYASSWALVHMLQLSEKYRSGFDRFMAAINAGKPSDEALQLAYAKSLKEVETDLLSYVRQRAVNTAMYNLQFDKSSDKIQPRDASRYEWDLARADLLTAARKYDLARARLEGLTKAEPGRPEAWESLSFLHWVSRAENGHQMATEAFNKALELKSTNPNLAYHSAGLTRDAKVIVTSLESLVDRYPDYADGRVRLAEYLLYGNQAGRAYQQLSLVKNVSLRQAPVYFPVLIQALWRLKAYDQCRAAAAHYQRVARTPATQAAAQTWSTYAMREPPASPTVVAAAAANRSSVPQQPELEAINSLVPPPPKEFQLEEGGLDVVQNGGQVRIVGAKLTYLEGTLVNLECKNPQAILSIKHDAGLTRLLIEDPTNVNLKMGTESKMELTCGTQSNKIKAGYFPRENGAEKTVGALATLEFIN